MRMKRRESAGKCGEGRNGRRSDRHSDCGNGPSRISRVFGSRLRLQTDRQNPSAAGPSERHSAPSCGKPHNGWSYFGSSIPCLEVNTSSLLKAARSRSGSLILNSIIRISVSSDPLAPLREEFPRLSPGSVLHSHRGSSRPIPLRAPGFGWTQRSGGWCGGWQASDNR